MKTNRLKSNLLNLWGALRFPLLAIIVGFIIGAFLILLAGKDPGVAYLALFQGSLGGMDKLGETFFKMTPILLTGLSFSIAFRTGLFNIGGEGQFLMGAITAVAIGWFGQGLPHLPLIILMILGAFLAGGLWASIAGVLKAKIGIHEVITSIMLNYTALYLVNYIVRAVLNPSVLSGTKAEAHTVALPLVARLTKFKDIFPIFGRSSAHTGILIAVGIAIIMYFVLFKTTLGYELRSGGLNPDAAEYGGIPKARNILTAMALSGAIAGIAGAINVMGITYYVAQSPATPGYGFEGIAVGLVGGLHPIGIIASSFLFGILSNGARRMQLAGIPKEVITIIQGIIIVFIASQYIIKIIYDFREKRNMKKQELLSVEKRQVE
ncbi:MAG: ABC transporter permease [Peptostreptococcales bacterium]